MQESSKNLCRRNGLNGLKSNIHSTFTTPTHNVLEKKRKNIVFQLDDDNVEVKIIIIITSEKIKIKTQYNNIQTTVPFDIHIYFVCKNCVPISRCVIRTKDTQQVFACMFVIIYIYICMDEAEVVTKQYIIIIICQYIFVFVINRMFQSSRDCRYVQLKYIICKNSFLI